MHPTPTYAQAAFHQGQTTHSQAGLESFPLDLVASIYVRCCPVPISSHIGLLNQLDGLLLMVYSFSLASRRMACSLHVWTLDTGMFQPRPFSASCTHVAYVAPILLRNTPKMVWALFWLSLGQGSNPGRFPYYRQTSIILHQLAGSRKGHLEPLLSSLSLFSLSLFPTFFSVLLHPAKSMRSHGVRAKSGNTGARIVRLEPQQVFKTMLCTRVPVRPPPMQPVNCLNCPGRISTWFAPSPSGSGDAPTVGLFLQQPCSACGIVGTLSMLPFIEAHDWGGCACAGGALLHPQAP